MTSRPARRLALVVPAVAALALTACASGGSGASASQPPTQGGSSSAAAAGAQLPEAYRNGIKVATDAAYAPNEFKNASDQITGFDYDLGQALGAKLGVPFQFSDVTFDGIIPALQAKKYDIVMSSMSDTKDREKVLTFVDYYTAGTSFVVPKGNPKHLTSLADLCGTHAAIEKGTTQDQVVTQATKDCTSKGKPAITIDRLPKDTDALLEIRSGKADVDLNDSPVAAYIAEQSKGAFDSVLIKDVQTAPYGIGTLRANTALATAIQGALKAVIADGTYAKLLDKYGIANGSLTTAQIDGAKS